jgi:hypothetical protein
VCGLSGSTDSSTDRREKLIINCRLYSETHSSQKCMVTRGVPNVLQCDSLEDTVTTGLAAMPCV